MKTGCSYCDKKPIRIAVWINEGGERVHHVGIPILIGRNDEGTLIYKPAKIVSCADSTETYSPSSAIQ